MQYSVRAAQISDLCYIQEMYNDAIAHTTAVYEYDPFDEAYMERWWKDKQAGNWPVMVFEKEGDVIAFGTYGTFRARAAYVSCVEHSLYVSHKHQGQGLGKHMLKVLIQMARQDGRHTMIAGIDATNEGSIGLHEKFGFREVGRMPEVAYKFDRWLDLVLLQLIL
jgi:L-amino acid N-acyltransferase